MTVPAYLTLADARRHLRLEEGEDEALLQDALDAATQACIDYMNRDLLSQSFTETLSGKGSDILPVNNFPVTAIASLAIDDVAIDLTTLTFKDAFIRRKTGVFPYGTWNVAVTYTAGRDEVPAPVKQAVRYTLKAMWDARGTDQNTTGEYYQGIMSGTFWPGGPGAVPPQAMTLLNDYRAIFKV